MDILEKARERCFAAFLESRGLQPDSRAIAKDVWDACWHEAMNLAAAAIQNELGELEKPEIH